MIEYDGRSIRQAAKELYMTSSWGVKWYKRYKTEGPKGLRDRSRSGRPSKVYPGIMSRVRQKARETACWTLQNIHEHIREYTGVEYSESHVLRILAVWGYVMKVVEIVISAFKRIFGDSVRVVKPQYILLEIATKIAAYNKRRDIIRKYC